ncbi:MAG: alpha/beta fold hydrolase [Planctomycetota bacterium]
MIDGFDNIVIVHGAFGDRHHWKAVAKQLEQNIGKPVYRVALTGQGERSHLIDRSIDLSTHIQDVVNLIEFEDLEKCCLIGHSYGGVLISAVSDCLPHRIARRIYLDAYLLNDGENFFSLHPELEADWKQRAKDSGDGWLIPPHWPNPHRDVRHPIATLVQPVSLKNDLASQIRSEYWLFTDGGTLEQDSLFCFYERAISRGWPVKDFKWDHNPHRNAPGELSKELIASLSY